MNATLGHWAFLAEQAYFYIMRPFHGAAEWVRWKFRPGSLTTCVACGSVAQWLYPSSRPRMDYCDECVGRGCSCNIIDRSIKGKLITEVNASGIELIWTDYGDVEPEQYRDDRGRLLPCCDFMFCRWGFRRRDPEEG